MERAPKPVGSWASLSEAVLARSQRVGLTAESLSAASASRQAGTAAMAAAQEAPSVPANHFIYRMAVLGDSLHLPDSSPTLEHLALCLPGDGMSLLFEKSCHGGDCCSCCFSLSGSVFILLLETGRGVGECPLPVTGKLPFFSRVNRGNGVTGHLSEDLQEAYEGEDKGCVSAGGKRGGNRTQVSPGAPDLCCLGLPAT